MHGIGVVLMPSAVTDNGHDPIGVTGIGSGFTGLTDRDALTSTLGSDYAFTSVFFISDGV
jgi:hypothetical protein